jgi:hypothetical protein
MGQIALRRSDAGKDYGLGGPMQNTKPAAANGGPQEISGWHPEVLSCLP